jgi:hypothetical protein
LSSITLETVLTQFHLVENDFFFKNIIKITYMIGHLLKIKLLSRID